MIVPPSTAVADTRSDGARWALRQATAEAHAALEAHPRLAVLGEDRPDAGRYADLLGCFAGWYRPLEAALAAAPAGDVPPDLDARWKAPLLARDLAALGLADVPPPHCADLPRLDGEAARLGALYVMEGATLGGALLADRLSHRGDLPVGFFGSYGADRGRRWRSFIAHLDQRLDTPQRRAAAGRTARLTFASLSRWLDDAPDYP